MELYRKSGNTLGDSTMDILVVWVSEWVEWVGWVGWGVG